MRRFILRSEAVVGTMTWTLFSRRFPAAAVARPWLPAEAVKMNFELLLLSAFIAPRYLKEPECC